MDQYHFKNLDIQEYEIDCNFMRKRRLELEYTQTYMAFCLGYKQSSSYYKYENGDQDLRAVHLPILAQLLECDIDTLFKKK